MDIQKRKIEFVQEFLRIQSEKTISLLEDLLLSRKALEGSEVQEFSTEELNRRIDRSLDDSYHGRKSEISVVREDVKKWR